MIKKIALFLFLGPVLLITLSAMTLRDNPARPTVGEPRQTDHEGISIRYYVSGPINAEPIVLLASYARSGSDFNELVTAINLAGYRTSVLQARGIDGSDLPDWDVSLLDYADDVAAVLDQERLAEPLTIVGHAFGNRIARAFSSRYPHKVRSLVLLAAGDSAPPTETRNDIFKILANILPDSIRVSALQRAFFAPDHRAPDYWIRGWYPRAGLAQGNATATTPQDQWVSGGQAPMLVVQPEHDAAAANGAKKLRLMHPDRVTVMGLEDAGHAILPEQPQRVSQLVLDHLSSRLTPSIIGDPLSGDSLFDSVEKYSNFGDHRTGGKADRATTDWLLGELNAAGFALEPQVFTLNQFFPDSQVLQLADRQVDVFPHWFPLATEVPVQAPLASLEDRFLAGRIAYVAPDKAGAWYRLRPAQLAADAAARGALALVIAVPHPSKEIYVTNAAPPHLQQPLPIPTVVVAALDHHRIQQSLDAGVSAVLTSRGKTQQVQARNLLAHYPLKPIPGRAWVVISSPISGWFTCAGERGSGVALWLGLARWIVEHGPGEYNWLFVANSGHELDFMGAHHSLKKMPPPEDVRLWLHLGASIAARQWSEQEGQLTPLDRVHQYNRMYGDSALMPLIVHAFTGVPDLEILPNSELNRGHSELGSIANAGYTAMGFVGSHRFFHTPNDTPVVTDAALLAPYGKALKQLAKALIQASD